MSTEEYVALFEDLNADFRDDPRIRVFLSPGNVQWCSDEFLTATKEAAARHGTGIHIHLQESFYQKLYGMRTWGKTPLAHLRDLGFTGPEVSCAHGVWITDSDIRTLAETGTMVCHNASSNLRLKSGVAPLNPMLANRVCVALGIDEAGINDDNDMIQEMRLVHKIHRQPGVYSPAPTSHQVLKLATENGARATFFGDDVGTLEVGKAGGRRAGGREPHQRAVPGRGAPIRWTRCCIGAEALDVDTVVVDGEVLMRGRQMTRVNKAEVWRALKDYLSRELSAAELERIEVAQELLPHVNKFYGQWHPGQGSPHYVYNQAA